MVIIRILFFIFFLFLTVNSEKTLHQFELNVNFPSIQLDKKFPSSSYERVEKALNGTIDILKNILLINSSGVITTQINKTELCDDVDLKYINDDIEFQNSIETDFIVIPLFD